MATPKTKTPTRAQYDKALTDLKVAIIYQRRTTADRDNAIRKVQEKHQPEIDRYAADAETARAIIQEYAHAHRPDLLPQGAKSVTSNGVTVGWKLSPAALALSEGKTWDDALELVRKKLPECIRKKEELDKTLLRKYAGIDKTAKAVAACGLELRAEEKFFIEAEPVA